MNMFERCARERCRFNSPNGLVSVEDLFRLPLKTLDNMYKSISANISKEDSLLESSVEDKELNFAVDVIKYIVKARLEEAEAKANRERLQSQKNKLKKILETKEEEELLTKSPEELKKMIADME